MDAKSIIGVVVLDGVFLSHFYYGMVIHTSCMGWFVVVLLVHKIVFIGGIYYTGMKLHLCAFKTNGENIARCIINTYIYE